MSSIFICLIFLCFYLFFYLMWYSLRGFFFFVLLHHHHFFKITFTYLECMVCFRTSGTMLLSSNVSFFSLSFFCFFALQWRVEVMDMDLSPRSLILIPWLCYMCWLVCWKWCMDCWLLQLGGLGRWGATVSTDFLSQGWGCSGIYQGGGCIALWR